MYRICFFGLLLCFAGELVAGTNIPIRLESENRSSPFIDNPVPELSWKMEDRRQGAAQTAYQILVAASPKLLAADAGDLWDSGKVVSSQSHLVPYGGAKLNSCQRVWWKVRIWDQNGVVSEWSERATWEMALLDKSDWSAKWIAAPELAEVRLPELDVFLKATAWDAGADARFRQRKPSLLFRKEVVLDQKTDHAVMRVCGLGAFNLTVNGEKVGDHILDPIHTDYDRQARYVNFDVTDLLKSGANCIGIEVVDGWFGQYVVWNGGFSHGEPRLLAQLEVEKTDGTRFVIGTDIDWKVHYGPVIRSNMYAGEYYDARFELPGWNHPGFDASAWPAAVSSKPGTPKLVAQVAPPMRFHKVIKPVAKHSPRKGVWTFDMGQNFAGVVRLKPVEFPRGTVITMRLGEYIRADDGCPATIGVSATKVHQTQQYVCKGGGPEEWTPQFCYSGFRYVEISGLPEEPDLDLIDGVQLRTAVEPAGHFRCSYDLFNTMHEMAVWTLESNIHGVLEDCPTRERCGWLGDAYSAFGAWFMNFRMDSFNRKFIEDIRDSYSVHPVDGLLMEIAGGKRRHGPPTMYDWMNATMVIPWRQYLYYGDGSELERHYKYMKDFADAVFPIVQERYNSGKLELGRKDRFFFGDWGDIPLVETKRNGALLFPAETPAMLTGTQMLIYGFQNLARSADALGHSAERNHYKKLTEELADRANAVYFDSEHATYGSQSANVWALYLGMVPEKSKEQFLLRIGQEVRMEDRGQITVGQFGLGPLFPMLTDTGNGDLVEKLCSAEGGRFEQMINRGGTTLWEYQGRCHPGSDPIGSLNHPAFSGYDTWFYQYLCGIRPMAEFPGFKKILFKPYFASWVDWAEADYESPYGTIQSRWKRNGDTVIWNIVVPPNSCAEIQFPEGSGKSAETVPSGKYQFRLGI
ncbi:family 78 glycoside hydrolase catalytic domain [Tichowtungia aerotolerans]|uniref:alpha-L-rhamnosidase n=1 Tax=Tichowtungia aerotolerans TaxID=2697043 RepID=A0A6P1MCJ4_9BACT|nr:family 78 glycoside hydrolase catalytic domain [Tichowtungia aerotolerans]QHI69788.1 family 78 glycoside hydrolase catalytic domain [Tichowtungia aerotolerans]